MCTVQAGYEACPGYWVHSREAVQWRVSETGAVIRPDAVFAGIVPHLYIYGPDYLD